MIFRRLQVINCEEPLEQVWCGQESIGRTMTRLRHDSQVSFHLHTTRIKKAKVRPQCAHRQGHVRRRIYTGVGGGFLGAFSVAFWNNTLTFSEKAAKTPG